MNTPSRPLDPGEAFFYMTDRVSCMNFVLFAERCATLEPTQIRNALNVIQQENPLLQTRIVWNEENGLRFEPAPDAPISLECHPVTENNWLTYIENELARPFAEDVAPLARCLYLQIDADVDTAAHSVLVVCFHHSIADGRSGEALLRRLLDCIANKTTLADAIKPPTGMPPMSAVVPERFRWTQREEEAEALMDVQMRDYKRHGLVARQPWLNSAAPTRIPRLIRLSLPPEATRRLLMQARAHESSVHGALCAAQLLAQYRLHRLHGGEQPSTLFLTCPIDLRTHLEPIQPTIPIGFYTSLLSASLMLDTHTDFWDLARRVVAQTRRQAARGEGHLFYNLYGLDGGTISPDRMARFGKAVLSSWQNTMVSNIGVVASVDNDPAVEAISFALCPMPYQVLFNAVSTYKDRLILNVGYDAGKLQPETAHTLTTAMQELLLAAANATTTATV
ncbi:MAG: hypothetical protein IPH35_02730 [Rhodoferax sp.]|nr:hypothetical protein [Rhodoferax sp.]